MRNACPCRLWLTLVSLGVVASGLFLVSVQAQEPTEATKAPKSRIDEIQRLLDETLVPTDSFQELMPLGRFLHALRRFLPQDERLALQIDKAAFGQRYPDLDQTLVKLPPFPKKMSLRTVLRLTLSKLDAEGELGFWPDHVAITTPKRAAYAVVYEVRDVLQQTGVLLPELQEMQDYCDGRGDLKDSQVTDNPLWLIRLIRSDVALRDWETIKVLNGSKLAVYATPSHHKQIEDWLMALRRLADLAVVMHARICEVDRNFYAKYLAPLVVQGQGKPQELPIVAVPRLAKSLQQQKVVLESDDLKIRPRQQTVFLSLQDTFRYLVHPGNTTDQAEEVYKDGLTGLAFSVQALVSPDRRFLRLHITQKVTELVGIARTTILDPATGRCLAVESPDLRKTSAAGTIQIADGQTIVMPVAYRPPGLADNRMWVLVAWPQIFIQEEEDQMQMLREGWSLARRRTENDKEDPDDAVSERRWYNAYDAMPPVPLANSGDVARVLQEVVTDALSNPQLKDLRELFGTPADKYVVLAPGATVAWPAGFQAWVPGFRLRLLPLADPFDPPSHSLPTVLGLQLHKFAWKGDGVRRGTAVVEIGFVGVFGGLHGDVRPSHVTVKYTVKRAGQQWRVILAEIVDQ
jgi:hypothetical protein